MLLALVQIRTSSGPDQTNKLTKPDQPILVGLEDPGQFNDQLLVDQKLSELLVISIFGSMKDPHCDHSIHTQDLIMMSTDHEHANSMMALYCLSPINTYILPNVLFKTPHNVSNLFKEPSNS